ncbi:MAG: hypothetical protein BWK79_20245 [Beggiatoa sp. IS2]|nr:MAG: hypothetical protein BWK79_20245 [Beggiatoa sp. IS2]
MLKQWYLFFPTILLSVSVQAIEITDYADPDIFYEDAGVSAALDIKDGNQDQISFDGNFSGNYEMVYSTKPFVWRGNLGADLDITRGPDEGSSTQKDFLIRGETTFDKYLTNDIYGLLGFGKVDMDYRKQDAGGSVDNDDTYAIDITGGVGYGRITEATPLAGTIRMVEELRRYGILLKEPNNETYLELAAIVNREDEFEGKYGKEDYRQYWIEELAKVLNREGLLKDRALGVTGTVQIYDVLIDELRNEVSRDNLGNALTGFCLKCVQRRAHGWIARVGIGYSFRDNIDFGSENDPLLSSSFQYEMPIGLAIHSALLESDPTHEIKNEFFVTYEITDRIDWVNEWVLATQLRTKDGAEDTLTNELTSGFNYHLTNLLDAFVVARLYDDDVRDDMDVRILMGIGYEIK